MNKDAYYFPHFCNARHDRKIMRLRKELGVEGYGIFFMLLEVLREQIDFKYPVNDVDLLADEFGCSEQKLRVVIYNYQLFQLDPVEQFFSPKLILYLQPYFERSEKARQMARKRWDKVNEISNECESNAAALPQECLGNTNKVKESKSNEIEESVDNATSEKQKFRIPSLDDVRSYCIERQNSVDAEKFVDFYLSKGWMVGKNKMKDWKAVVRNWERDNQNTSKLYKSKLPIQSENKRQYDVDKLEKDLLKRQFVQTG